MGIPFLVLHGLEGFPDRIGRDLDTLMDQKLSDRALVEAAKVLDGLDWLSVRPPDIWGKRLVALKSKGGGDFDYLELHTFGALRWFVIPLVEVSEVASHTIGPFPASYWATFMKTLISPVLAGDLSRITSEYIDHHVRSAIPPHAIRERCSTFFGIELGTALVAGLDDCDPSQFIDNRKVIRRLLLARAFKQPVVSLRETPAFLRKRSRRVATSPGLHVLLEAPRTSQMNEVLGSLVAKLSNVFVEIDVRNPGIDNPTIAQRRRLRGRQTLVIEHIEYDGPGRTLIRLSISGPPGSAQSVELNLDEQTEPAISGYLAEWILTSWVRRHSP